MRRAAKKHGLFAPTTKWDDLAATAKEDEDSPFVEREMMNQLNLNKELRKRIKQTLSPTEGDMVVTTPLPDAHTPRAASEMQHPDFWLEGDINPMESKEACMFTEMIEPSINAIHFESTTQEEQAPQCFTWKKLKKLKTLGTWEPMILR